MPRRAVWVVLAVTLCAGVSAAALAGGSDLRPGFSRATCDTGSFSIDALKSPTGAQHADTAPARKLRALIRDPSSDPYIEGRVPKRGWRLLERNRRNAMFGSGGATRITPLALRKTKKEGWSFYGLDTGCRPRVISDRLEGESWRLDSEAPPPTPSTTALSLLVRDRDCNSGEPPDPERIRPPIIEYGQKAVTIAYFIEPPEGSQTCEGTPPGKVTLSLAEPLGDRALRDGGFVVPRQRFPKRE